MSSDISTTSAAWEPMLTAAEHMRQHHGLDHPRHLFWGMLADWLDLMGRRERARVEASVRIPVTDIHHASAIATAYLEALDAD